MSKGSSALPLSRGSAGPKMHRNSTASTGNWLIFQCHRAVKVDAVWNAEPGSARSNRGNSWTPSWHEASETRDSASQPYIGPVKRRARCPYRDPTQVLWQRKPRPVGRTDVREFGKLVPYLRKKGCLLSTEQVAVTRALRLSNNNTGDRKSARTRTVTESCPVRVSEHSVQ